MTENCNKTTRCYVADSLKNAERSFNNLCERLARLSVQLDELLCFIEVLEDIADREEDVAHKDVVELAKKIGKLRQGLNEEPLKEFF